MLYWAGLHNCSCHENICLNGLQAYHKSKRQHSCGDNKCNVNAKIQMSSRIAWVVSTILDRGLEYICHHRSLSFCLFKGHVISIHSQLCGAVIHCMFNWNNGICCIVIDTTRNAYKHAVIFIFVDMPSEKAQSSYWLYSLKVIFPQTHLLGCAVQICHQRQHMSSNQPQCVSNWMI